MNAETLTALRGSIAKWEAIVAGTGEDKGTGKGCPVSEKTGKTHCDGSPYEQWSVWDGPDDYGEAIAIAQAEIDFLRSLLPPDELS